MWFVFESARGERGIWGIPATGGEPELLRQGNVGNIRWAPDSQTLFFWRPNDRDGNIWALSLDDRSERRVTDLIGPKGRNGWPLATDGRYLYFGWDETLGDIWVMDVVQDEE